MDSLSFKKLDLEIAEIKWFQTLNFESCVSTFRGGKMKEHATKPETIVYEVKNSYKSCSVFRQSFH